MYRACNQRSVSWRQNPSKPVGAAGILPGCALEALAGSTVSIPLPWLYLRPMITQGYHMAPRSRNLRKAYYTSLSKED